MTSEVVQCCGVMKTGMKLKGVRATHSFLTSQEYEIVEETVNNEKNKKM